MKKYLLFVLALVVAGCTGGDQGQDSAQPEAQPETGTMGTTAGEGSTQGGASALTPQQEEAVTMGLIIDDKTIGNGAEATAGDSVSVHYTGWLYDESKPDNKGEKFDSSVDRGSPYVFPLGAGRVIQGWDVGVAGMKVGGSRTLTIPSDMAYGDRNIGPIPAGSTLIFDVELLGVN